MKNAALRWTLFGVAALATTAGFGGLTQALAGDRDREPAPPAHYSGLLDDSTPYLPSTIKGSPYQMHGHWSLNVDERRKTATFSAAMNMETSDLGVMLGVATADNPASRGAHTHHISMPDGVVTSDWQTRCPTFSPAVENGFVVTGTATLVTGNGGPAPFGNPSSLTICVLGGTKTSANGGPYVDYSNITLTFGTPASNHFGTFAIHGVIVRCGDAWERDEHECTVQE